MVAVSQAYHRSDKDPTRGVASRNQVMLPMQQFRGQRHCCRAKRDKFPDYEHSLIPPPPAWVSYSPAPDWMGESVPPAAQ